MQRSSARCLLAAAVAVAFNATPSVSPALLVRGPPRRTPVKTAPSRIQCKSSHFNRDGLIDVLRQDVLKDTDCVHVIMGPRSCGKTMMITQALEESAAIPVKVMIDLRGQTTTDKAGFHDGIRWSFRNAADRMRKSLLKWWNPNRWLPRWLRFGMTALVGVRWTLLWGGFVTFQVAPEILDGVSKKPDQEVVQGIDQAIDAINDLQGRLVIYIDELNRVQSKGDPEDKWKDKFTEDLLACLIRNTKQSGKAVAVIVTSDQQYAEQFLGKPDFKVHCLGYMSDEELDKFLQSDEWDGPAVPEPDDRKKIIDSLGGFFPALRAMREAAQEGKLDEAIEAATYRAVRDAISKVGNSGNEAECIKALGKLAPSLGGPGYISADKALEMITKEMLNVLISSNLVQLRYRNQRAPEIWAPDLPSDAQRMEVVTPYLPIDRKWLSEFGQHFPRSP